MSLRCAAPLVAALLLSACLREPSAGTGAESDGRLRLALGADSPARYVEALARGSYCPSDTAVVVVATGDDAAAAVALRTAWPVEGRTTFAIERVMGGVGTAAVAMRRLQGDSVVAATVAVRGTVRLDVGPRLEAVVEAVALDSAGAEVPLTGRLEGVSVRRECGPR
jgi:hypothetical protein